MTRVYELLRRARYLQPFNAFATQTVRAACQALGVEWDWAIQHLHRVGEVRSRLPNGSELVLWSRADDWVSNQVFWRGWRGYEPQTAPIFFELASRARVTLDVGAYVGFYTLLAAHANPSGKVFAFEPLPANVQRHRANVDRNRLTNVECIEAAVGDAEGSQKFFHSPIGLPCSSSLSKEFMASLPDLTSTEVPVVTIDAFCAARDMHVDLLKIDTETTEPAVLRGARATLERFRPDIICEVLASHGTGPSLEASLGPLDYSYFLLTPHGPRHVSHIEGHPEWLNYLFTPPARGDAPIDAGRTRAATPLSWPSTAS